jgi:hypothetical protein
MSLLVRYATRAAYQVISYINARNEYYDYEIDHCNREGALNEVFCWRYTRQSRNCIKTATAAYLKSSLRGLITGKHLLRSKKHANIKVVKSSIAFVK